MQQLSRSASAGLAVNIGAYIGFNSVWASVVGQADRRPSAEEVTQMRAISNATSNRAHGGIGGPRLQTGYFAHTDEVVRVVAVAAPWRTIFPNHERLTPESNFSSRAGIAETIKIGIDAGLAPRSRT